MPDFRFLKMGSDVIAASLEEVQNNTWLIYPTERSCREAREAYQKQWQPLKVTFLSMEEAKARLIYSNQICLEDEKRLVCLYQAMTEEDKTFFHIVQYNDLVDWGRHFFELFEDLAEEQIEAADLLFRLENYELSCQEWQLQNFRQMLKIRTQYQQFLSVKGFSDKIFDLDLKHFLHPKDASRIVFANQFYYTKLERALINKLEDNGIQVVILYQGEEKWLNKETLQSSELNLEEAFGTGSLPFSFEVKETGNIWQMATAFLQDFASEQETQAQTHFIIDAEFLNQPYHEVFSPFLFNIAEPQYLSQTRLFLFLQAIGNGLENIIIAGNKISVRLDWLLQAVGVQGFINYFRPQWNNAAIDKFLAFVCRFSEEDILYLDFDLQVLSILKWPVTELENIELLADIVSLLQRLSNIKSAKDLADFIDSRSGIEIDQLLTDEEKTSTNLKEAFYTALANFIAIDELSLVENWQSLYPDFPLSACIFALFVNFLKPRKYRISEAKDNAFKATVTNVMDTRNLKADKLSFLNLTEGILPGSRTPVWLFNEKQRNDLGLKTWGTIRNWERYYFYRIIATASEVRCYTIVNIDDNIEPSSFLNELHEFYLQHCGSQKNSWQKLSFGTDIILKNLLQSDLANPLTAAVELNDLKQSDKQNSFFNIPFDRKQDIGETGAICFSWSSCERFIRNAYYYFLRDVNKLKERTFKVEETLNRRLFGKLLHSYFMNINHSLAERHQGELNPAGELIAKTELEDILNKTLRQQLWNYQLPANYNKEFFAQIVTPFLIKTAWMFFHDEFKIIFKNTDQKITIIPEEESSTPMEQQNKLLMTSAAKGNEYQILIHGRADLRAETATDKYIIDFKTGGLDKLQLIFYAWFYYLIEHPEEEKIIHPSFYNLLTAVSKKIIFNDKQTAKELKDKIADALQTLAEQGYTPPSVSKSYDCSLNISRADLVKNFSYADEDEEEE